MYKTNSIGKKCKICGSDDWLVVDNPNEYVEDCLACARNNVDGMIVYRKQDFVSKFECPDCGGLSGTLEENDLKLGVRCSNCNKLVIMIEKHPSMTNNRNIVQKQNPVENKPKCPTCGSVNIKKIGTGDRVASVAMFGLFSKKINKSFKCKFCGYTW